jgi:hypothetical protein
MGRWSKVWQWIYSVPAHNPMLDTTATVPSPSQMAASGIPPVIDPGGVASFTHLHHPLWQGTPDAQLWHPQRLSVPGSNFKPADGQTLYQFLLAGAQGGLDTLLTQSLLVDGVKLAHIFDYRETSGDIFSIKGDLTLQTVLDGCITGSKQPAVSDAFVIMLRELPRGAHLTQEGIDGHGRHRRSPRIPEEAPADDWVIRR